MTSDTKFAAPTAHVPDAITIEHVLARGGGVPAEARLIDFDGGRFIIPVQYASEPMKGAEKLLELFRAMEEDITQSVQFEYRVNDVRVALARILRRIGVSYSSTNSPMKLPSDTTINIGFNDKGKMQTIVVPDDWSKVPNSKSCSAAVIAYRSKSGALNGALNFQFKRYDQALVTGIIGLVQDELDQRSIYRGHVINGALEYIDVSKVDADRVVYTQTTGDLLGMWALNTIENAEMLRKKKMKTKVSIMLAGTYGTGKTEFLLLIASMAWRHGWTTLFCRPGVDDFGQVLETARMYMKHGKGVLVVAEDVEAWGVDRERMLDMWDGFGSKQDNALFVVTSNFPEKLDPGMLRPGRLDAVIEIGQLDVPSFEKLCRLKLGNLLADDVDFEAVFAANHDYTPAFMVGALESVVRATIYRTKDALPKSVSTEDLINAAMSFRPQLELQQAAVNRKDPLPTLDQAFRANTAAGVQDGIEVEVDVNYDYIQELTRDAIDRKLDGAQITDVDGDPWTDGEKAYLRTK